MNRIKFLFFKLREDPSFRVRDGDSDHAEQQTRTNNYLVGYSEKEETRRSKEWNRIDRNGSLADRPRKR